MGVAWPRWLASIRRPLHQWRYSATQEAVGLFWYAGRGHQMEHLVIRPATAFFHTQGCGTCRSLANPIAWLACFRQASTSATASKTRPPHATDIHKHPLHP